MTVPLAWLVFAAAAVALWALLMLVLLAKRGVEDLSTIRVAVARLDLQARQVRTTKPE